MDLIRLDRPDLDDLRYFIRYVDEKGMTVEEVNEVLYYLGDKYGFDPLENKINLMTGIVVPKQPSASPPPPAQRTREVPQAPEPPSPREKSPLDPSAAVEAMRAKAQEAADGLRVYRITGGACAVLYAEPEACGALDYTKELDGWITGNNLTYLEARRMIASLELKKRMGELRPEVDCTPSSGKLAELEDWISHRRLSYFKVRMMIAQLGQDEERGRLVAAVD